MRTSAVLGLAAGLTIMMGSASARVSTLANEGSWTAFGGTSDNGTPMCGMSSSGGGKWFGVKYFKGDTGFTVHSATKPGSSRTASRSR